MNCPIDEILLIDYLEGELEPEAARRVEQHLESCPVCRAEYESLIRVRDAIAGAKESAVAEPGEYFWKENLEAVARATYMKDSSSAPVGKVLIFRRFSPRVIAAAAVVLLAVVGAFRLGLGPLSRTERPATELVQVDEDDQAYTDFLYQFAEAIYKYQIALNAVESMVEIASDQESGSLPDEMEFPAYSSAYDGLAELEDDQLEQVMYSLASEL